MKKQNETHYGRGRQPMTLFKKIMALFISRGAKKSLPKRFGRLAKKYELMALSKRRSLIFPFFWRHKRLATPALWCSIDSGLPNHNFAMLFSFSSSLKNKDFRSCLKNCCMLIFNSSVLP